MHIVRDGMESRVHKVLVAIGLGAETSMSEQSDTWLLWVFLTTASRWMAQGRS